jgi:hypothetical protein
MTTDQLGVRVTVSRTYPGQDFRILPIGADPALPSVVVLSTPPTRGWFRSGRGDFP